MKRSSDKSITLFIVAPAALVAILFLMMAVSAADAAVLKRSPSTEEQEMSRSCSRSSPCGWFVYKPFVRTLDYHIYGPCTCPSGTRCFRVDDDISISAFIYRCRTPAEVGDSAEELPPKATNGTDSMPTNA